MTKDIRLGSGKTGLRLGLLARRAFHDEWAYDTEIIKEGENTWTLRIFFPNDPLTAIEALGWFRGYLRSLKDHLA